MYLLAGTNHKRQLASPEGTCWVSNKCTALASLGHIGMNPSSASQLCPHLPSAQWNRYSWKWSESGRILVANVSGFAYWFYVLVFWSTTYFMKFLSLRSNNTYWVFDVLLVALLVLSTCEVSRLLHIYNSSIGRKHSAWCLGPPN